MARTLIIVGALILCAGLIWQFVPDAARLVSWFGRLPGDIRYRNGGVTVFVPITSMILVSLALSLIVRLFR